MATARAATSGRDARRSRADNVEADPGLGGVAFLQNGRSAPTDNDPAADEQPEIPEFTPAAAAGAAEHTLPKIFEGRPTAPRRAFSLA